MQGADMVEWGDESDHLLEPFSIAANAGGPVPAQINEAVFRAALGGTVYPKAVLKIEPFERGSDWFARVTRFQPERHGDPDDPEGIARENERIGKWRQLFDWFRGHPDLHAPVSITFAEQGFATAYPMFLLALTESGSLVGLATCVVWS
jgi:hypothetical protein